MRSLPPEEAARGIPARLRGNLLLVTVPGNAIVLYDGTEGIYVELAQPLPAGTELGDLLEVAGVTDAGDFAPIVRATTLVRLGPGRLPSPRVQTIAELNAGGYDAAWVELRGIVRSCVPTPPDRLPVSRAGALVPGQAATFTPARESWLLNFAQGENEMTVQLNGNVVPSDLVDAEVRIRAVVFNVHNTNRQFVRANLQVPAPAMIEVLRSPPSDPFALPVQPVGSLLRFSRTGFDGHRVRVRGTVTGQSTGQSLWVRAGDRGMRIDSALADALAPGDEVDIVGFPKHGSYTPSLGDAIFRKVGAGPAPAPLLLRSAEEVSQHDANLVQLYATLRELRATPDGPVLVLDWQGIEVVARFLGGGITEEVATWRAGSSLRVDGICSVGQINYRRPTGRWVAQDLQLLLRTPADVTVLRAAPWLTTQRALTIVIALALVTLLALVVVAVLARRQIRQREDARKLAEVEFAAMLAERNRLARELHDTVAQDLNAVSMQLELARNSARSGQIEPAQGHLASAHTIVRHCLTEARESIWNMRSHILERTDLPGALQTVAEQLSAGRGCEIRTRVLGRPRRLAPAIENNLLRIGQEAISNALKHAQPSRIELELTFEEPSVRLLVRNDGAPFNPESAATATSHFGLAGMRERVGQMNGTFRIGPDFSGGTRLEVVVDAPSTT